MVAQYSFIVFPLLAFYSFGARFFWKLLRNLNPSHLPDSHSNGLVFFLFVLVAATFPYSPSSAILIGGCLVFVPYYYGVAVSLRVGRCGFTRFFASFYPADTSLSLGFLVCITELISFVVRPIVLLARPLINLSFAHTVSVLFSFFGWSLFSMYSWSYIVVYELALSCLHWYIVCCLVEFSERG